jgi:hypothetical protein
MMKALRMRIRIARRAWPVIVAVAIIVDKVDDIITQLKFLRRESEDDPEE